MRILIFIVIIVASYFLLTQSGILNFTQDDQLSGSSDDTTKPSFIKLPSFLNQPPESSDSTPNSPESPEKQINEKGAIGSLNHEYLQGTQFKKIVIEIDSVRSKDPSGSVKNTLKDTLEDISDKPKGIVYSGGNEFDAVKDSYSISDIRSLSDKHRSQYSDGETIVLHILYLNGSYAGNSSALGVAYNASSFVIFKDQINKAVSALVLGSAIERAVMIHEMGHILGLVNLTYQSDIGHEDIGHRGHSNNQESVMYWAVEDISVANVLRLGPSYKFDEDDKKDIDNIKRGIY